MWKKKSPSGLSSSASTADRTRIPVVNQMRALPCAAARHWVRRASEWESRFARKDSLRRRLFMAAD
ncbi:MAG: hypothetical protein WCD16_10280 [Paracoccaceae bacterium]